MSPADGATTNAIAMPPAEQLAVDAVQRLINDGYTSSLMKLPRPTLNELGRRLVQPGETVNDAAVEYLGEEGHDVPKSNVYRFAQRFRETYALVWGEWANRLLLTQLQSDPDYDTEDLQRLIKNRVHTLVAQEVMTSSPDQLDNGRLANVISLITAADKGQLEREKLLIAQAQAEHRALKSEAEVERLRVETDLRERRIDEAVKALQTRFTELSKRAQSGQAIDPAEIQRLHDELAGVSTPGRAA
ncbi:MAG: hypothetical protein AAGF84_03820 [Planctomycetota bacterium]